MKKLSFYLSLLKYSILHPKGGIQLLDEANQVREDSKQDIKKFGIAPLGKSQIFSNLFGKSYIKEENGHLNELEGHLDHFFKNIKGVFPSKQKPYPIDYSINGVSGPFIYELCKIIKPENVVETGVAYGASSAYILKAMHENKKGTLTSIDSVFRPWQSEKMIGAAIPENLRSRWELNLGSSSDILEKILQNKNSIDIFLHDSLHTYRNMSFEFHTSWPYIKKDGFLLSDDITSNNAFYDFVKKRNLNPLILLQNSNSDSYMGILQKNSND